MGRHIQAGDVLKSEQVYYNTGRGTKTTGRLRIQKQPKGNRTHRPVIKGRAKYKKPGKPELGKKKKQQSKQGKYNQVWR